jgi:hypothetical protein
MKTNFKWTIRFGILTPILIIICIILMGGGHGWYTPTIVLFPWAMVNVIWQDHLSTFLMIAGILQFILYGLLIDKARGTKARNWITGGILILHIILAVAILIARGEEWR